MSARAQSQTTDSPFDSRFVTLQKLKKATRDAIFPHSRQSSKFKPFTANIPTARYQFVDNTTSNPIGFLVTHPFWRGAMAAARYTSRPKMLAYRKRLAEAGEREVIFRLKGQTLAIIDEIKERQGLSNRGQVLEHENSARELLKSLEQRRENTQQ